MTENQPSISLIHPSRSRPKMAEATFKKWVSSAANRSEIVEYILSVDSDDPCLSEYEALPVDKLLISDNKSAIQAINRGAKQARGNILVCVSDDFDCPQNWDSIILKATEGKTDWLLRIDDGLQKYIVTLPIMDKAYYDRFGYIYDPEVLHLFADTIMTCQADLLGKIISCPAKFPHNHHSRTGLTDEVSRKNDSTWKQGEALFIERAKNYFNLNPEEIGRITDKKMIQWLRQHGVNLYV